MTAPAPQAIELATAYVSIVGETDKLARSVKDAVTDAQRYADTHPLDLKANVDVSHIGAVEIPVTADTSRFTTQVRDAITNAQTYARANPIDIRANIDVSHVGSVNVRVVPDTFTFAQQLMRDLRDMENSGLFRFGVPVDLDSAQALAQFAALRRALEGMATPIRQEVDVDVNRGALDRLKSLGSAGGIGLAAGGLSAAAAGIAAIGGAAGAALGAVGALGVGLAALGPAALAAGATAAVGLQGIGDAFKALSAAEDAAATDGQAQAKAVAAAQKQVETAIKGVASAEKDLRSAKKDAADAENDLTQARKDAQEQLEDYRLTLADAALSEKEAALAVREAQKDVFDAKTPEEREKALLRVERAQLSYEKAVERNRDVQQEAAEAERKGVEGADNVVAAKDRVAEANDRVTDAEQKLIDANAAVVEAQAAVAQAASASSSAQNKAAQALADLSPNAQAFVLAARDLAPAWGEVKDAVQDSLFDGAAEGITELAKNALPTLKNGMVDVAQSMNSLTRGFAEFWQAPQNLDAVREIFRGTADFIDGMIPGLHQATTGFLSLGQAFAPVAEKVGAQFGGMLGQIGQAFTDTFQDGQLTQLISTFGDILQGLGEGLNPLIQGLIQMGNIVGPTLGPTFAELGRSIQAIAPAMGQLGATFMTTLTGLLPTLSQFISVLASGLEPVLPVIGQLLNSLAGALLPLVGPMSEIAQIVGIALAQAIDALAPSIGPLGAAFAALVNALAPILPVIAEVASGLIQALAPALATIFDALGPVIQQWADLMMPVFRQLQPILADVAMQIGQALAQAIQSIAPVLPQLAQSFGGLVMAIAPLLPQLVKMAADLLPPLVQLLIEFTPVLTRLIDAFTWFVNNVISPLVIPALQKLGDHFKSSTETAVNAVRTAKDILGRAVEEIKSVFSGLGDKVREIWQDVVYNVAKGVKRVGELLVRAGNSSFPFPGKGSAKSLGESMVNWAVAQGAATGGFATAVGIARPVGGGRLVRGPGTTTSDSILAMLNGRTPIALSDREFISTAEAYENGAPLLWALNQGWVPSPEFLAMLTGMRIPGFAEGGVPGKKFAESMDPVPYEMGGFSRSSIDCSGMVAAVINDALGLDPFSGRMSTMNEGQWLAAKGAEPGLGGPGDISVGWFDRGGGANGHTALTLGDGTNVESRGGDGVVVGSSAAGADDPMFDQHMHIPKELLLGGDLGGPPTGEGAIKGGRPGKLGALGGGGTGGGTTGGGTGAGGTGLGSGTRTNGVVEVFVTNWPTDFTVGGPATTGLSGSTTSTDPLPLETAPGDPGTLSTTQFGPTTPASTTEQAAHPLANLPVPGAAELFNGPAPWYLAATPEQAAANLGTQAASLAQRTGSDVMSFFQDNWREMLDTGLAVAGMGVAGGGGTTFNISGTDPMGAARAVERVHRRQTLAKQRSGGFGR
ncbi:hypothetical protein IU414_06630 [Nocardia farcinica]|uniref:hypothetical protein n=1 Tax=Nocardia farcinica TaxID=37329 RepID=UPI00189320CB|nr:hypothetical protein [Nocardia farcinica]MBF6584435.1 hypothetical protein [Nocardia farcinica]